MADFTLTKNTNYQNYALAATQSATITPYDSGTILGTVPPGQVGLKLIDGTQQSATTAAADGTVGNDGNFVGNETDPTVNDRDNLYGPTNGQSKGYSLLGE